MEGKRRDLITDLPCKGSNIDKKIGNKVKSPRRTTALFAKL
jgi:uncharacterized Zn ribbon protein